MEVDSSTVVREWLNGMLIPLTLCIQFIIFRSLWEARKYLGSQWNRAPGVASACALLWIFLADGLRATMAWSLLHQQLTSHEHIEFRYLTIIYIISGVIAATATFRLIYTLSPARWGHRG